MSKENELRKLADFNMKVGDIVTFSSDKESTGGVLFVIEKNFDSPIPVNAKVWGRKHVDPTTGRPLKPMEVDGYVRLKPVFKFYPTELGDEPKGAKGTVLVYHYSLEKIKKVDIVEMATKYAELGNLIRDLAKARGADI